MPTLEDTIDFPVTTLNDLLEADAKGGIAVGADEDKYRRWAFLSSGAAGILAVILVVVLITGTGGDDGGGGGGKEVAQPPNTSRTRVTMSESNLPGDVVPGALVDVRQTSTGTVLARGATVLTRRETGEVLNQKQITLDVAVKDNELQAVESAAAEKDVRLSVTSAAPAEQAPADQAPAEPAPAEQTPPEQTPPEPAPAEQTPPASG